MSVAEHGAHSSLYEILLMCQVRAILRRRGRFDTATCQINNHANRPAKRSPEHEPICNMRQWDCAEERYTKWNVEQQRAGQH